MKCPKCHYISFDYNQVCPKCSKDLSVEQEKLNVPAFKPDPPSLLGGLLGDAHPDTHLSVSAELQPGDQDHEMSMEEASSIGTQDAELDDSREIDLDFELHEDKEGLELEGVLEEPGSGLHSAPQVHYTPSAEEPGSTGKSQVLGAISMEEDEVFARGGEKKEEDRGEISLELDEITLEGAGPDEKGTEPEKPQMLGTISMDEGEVFPGAGEKREEDGGEISLELEEITLESDGGVNLKKPEPSLSDTAELVLDIDPSQAGEGEAPAAEEHDEITLSLDDLKVNETGELEIGRDIAAASGAKGVAQPSMEMMTETPAAESEKGGDDLMLLLGDDAIEISVDSSEVVETLDLENLDLELDLEEPERK